jgi:hypothetical protein
MFITLCIFCACGRAKEPVTTEPTTAPPTTAVPTTKKTEPETVISYDFRLDELPDVGKYRPKEIRYFYDEPLKEFRTSERYGTLIPYHLSFSRGEYGGIGNCGLMTAEGALVTGCIYSELYAWQIGRKTVFLACGKAFDRNPLAIPDWETDEEAHMKAYEKAEAYCEENLRYYLISADGSKCLTFRERPEFITESGIVGTERILCCEYETETAGDETIRCIDSFVLYDADLEEVADFSRYLRDYNYARVMYCGDDIMVIEADYYSEAAEERKNDLLFFHDGVYDHTLEMGDESVYAVHGRLVECEKRLYDENGHTVFRFGDTHPDLAFDPVREQLYVAETDKGTLSQLDRDGNVLDSVSILASAQPVYCWSYADDDDFYLIVQNGPYDHLKGFLVYNGDLQKIGEIDCADASETNFCVGYNGVTAGLFLVARDGKTEIFDITGKKQATAPFEYSDYDFNYRSGDTGLLFLSKENLRCAVYDLNSHAVSVLPHFGKEPPYTLFFSDRLLVYSEQISVGEHDDWQYVIRDIATGKTLNRNIDDLDVCPVNGEVYFSYLKNGTLYVCDEELKVIAALNDSINV